MLEMSSKNMKNGTDFMKKIEPGGVSDRSNKLMVKFSRVIKELHISILLSSYLTPGLLFLQSVYQIVV